MMEFFRGNQLVKLIRLVSSLIYNRIFGRPTIMMHAVTEACNARCSYCVFRHGHKTPNELSVAEIGKLYHDAHTLGIRYVHLWGGEPLAHSKIKDVMLIANSLGMTIGMVTNGKLLFKKINKVGPLIDRLNVSIDYPGQKHDVYRGVPGLYDVAIKGIREFRRRWPDKKVVISFTLHRDNADSINDMIELCKNLGAKLYINPMRMGSNSLQPEESDMKALEVNNSELVLSWEEQLPFWRMILDKKLEGAPIQNSSFYIKNILRSGGAPSYRCHWPKISIGVDANGDVVDCEYWDLPLGNIRENPLGQILNQDRALFLKGPGGEDCNACISPARVEPSGIWGFNPYAWLETLKAELF